jgi:hypothetical protein
MADGLAALQSRWAPSISLFVALQLQAGAVTFVEPPLAGLACPHRPPRQWRRSDRRRGIIRAEEEETALHRRPRRVARRN